MSSSTNPQPPGPRLAAAAIFVHDGGIPLVRQASGPAGGRWSLPAGDVRRGETPQVAAVREALAETGLRVAPLGILEAYAQDEDTVLVAYSADVLGGELRAPASGAELQSFPPEELPWADCLDATRLALRDYVRRYFPRVRVPR